MYSHGRNSRKESYVLSRILLVPFLFSIVFVLRVYSAAEVKFESFRKNAFDQVFSRADRLGDGLLWRQAVESGKQAIRATWEAAAVEQIEVALREAPAADQTAVRSRLEAAFAIEKAAWEAEAGAYIELREGEWMASTNDLAPVQVDRAALTRALERASSNYVHDDFSVDLARWDLSLALHRASNRAIAAAATGSRVSNLIAGSSLSGHALAGFVDTLMRRSQELLLDWDISCDYMVMRRRNVFVATRLYDRESLKRASDASSARRVVEEVITRAGSEARRNAEEFLRQNGVEMDDPDLPDLSAPGSEWQGKVQQAINSGLQRWKGAYDELLQKMNDWEAEASTTIEKGNQLWRAAYERITTAREQWVKEIKGQIRRGLASWEGKEQQAVFNRQEAEARLDGYIQQQQSEWEGYTGQINSLFSQGSGAIATSRQNVEWLTSLVADYRKHAFTNGVLQSQLASGRAYIFYTNELARWRGIKRQFERLTDNALSRFHNGDMWSGAAGISMLSNSSDAYLYTGAEFSLKKVEQQKSYWSNRLEIARSVYLYATNRSAGREDAEATENNLSNARAALKNSEAVYTNALYGLNTLATSNVSWFQGVLSSNQSVLAVAQSNFQVARAAYDEKLYMLRLMENSTNSTDILEECNQNYAAYEASRLRVAEAQSNYMVRYVRLAGNERVYSYGQLVAETASNMIPVQHRYERLLSIVTNINSGDRNSLLDSGYRLAANLPSLFPGDRQVRGYQISLSSTLGSLDSAGTNVTLSMQHSFTLIRIMREIEEQLALPLFVSASNISLVLSPESVDQGALYRNRMRLQYELLSNRASANLSAVELVVEKVSNYRNLMDRSSVSPWTKPDGDMRSVFTGSNLAAQLINYADAGPGGYSQGDGVQYLYSWYAENHGLLASVWTNTGAGLDRASLELMAGVQAVQSSARFIASWFGTNSFTGRESLSAAEDFMGMRSLAAEEAVSGIFDLLQSDLEVADRIMAFAIDHGRMLHSVAGDEEPALYSALQAVVDDPAGIRSRDIASLRRMAEAVVAAAQSSSRELPEFMEDALQDIREKAVELEKRQYLFEQVGRGGVSASNRIAAELDLARSNANWHATGIELAESIVMAGESWRSNFPALMHGIASNRRFESFLERDPEGMMQYLTNCSSSNSLQALHTAAGMVYETGASNYNVYLIEAGKLSYALSCISGELSVSSMRDYFELLTTANPDYTGDTNHPADIPISIAMQSGDSGTWSVDVTGSGKGSALTHAVATNTWGNSVLDAAAALSDTLVAFSRSVLPWYNRLITEVAAGSSAYLADFQRVYSSASGITNMGGFQSFVSNVEGHRKRVQGQNLYNDSELVQLEGMWRSSVQRVHSTAGELFKNGRFYDLVRRTSADRYLKSKEVVAVKNSLAEREEELCTAQSNHDIARQAYDTASRAYFDAMSTVAARGRSYEAVRQQYDVAQAVYTYASTPYSSAASGTESSNSAADARTEYERILNRYQQVQAAYSRAKARYENRVSLQKLDTEATNAGYRHARDVYTNASISCMRLDRGYADMSAEVARLKQEIQKLKEECAGIEGKYFQKGYEKQPDGRALRNQLLGRMFASTPEAMLGDFSSWVLANKIDNSIYRREVFDRSYDHRFWPGPRRWPSYWYDRRYKLKDAGRLYRKRRIPGFEGCVRVHKRRRHYYDHTTGTYTNTCYYIRRTYTYHRKTYTGDARNSRLYEALFSNSRVFTTNTFMKLGYEQQTIEGFENVVGFFRWLRKYYNSMHTRKMRNRAKKHLKNFSKPYAELFANIKEDFKKLQPVYSKIAKLEEKIGVLTKVTIDTNVHPGIDLSQPGVIRGLSRFREKMTTQMHKYGMRGSDIAYFSGASGLTNLAHTLRDLKALRRTIKTDRFGNELYNGTNAQYECWVDITVLIEQLKNLRLADQREALQGWKQVAAESGVDGALLLKDRERALYSSLIHADSTINNVKESQSYVSIAGELTAIGNQAWQRIKAQERELQLQKWDFKMQGLAMDKDTWYATVVDIFGRGVDQWTEMDSRFNREWNSWLSTTRAKLDQQRQKWQAAADSLVQNRDSWLERVSEAASQGAANTLALAGVDAIESSISGILGNLPGGFTTSDFDADKLAADILRENRVVGLPEDFMKVMDNVSLHFDISELSRLDTADAAAGFDRMMREFEKAGVIMENIRLFDTLDRTIDSYKKMLTEADKQTAASLGRTLSKEGFKNQGKEWTRRAIVDATLWKTYWSTQVVPGYESYTLPEFSYNIRADGAAFTVDRLAGMNTAEVEALATASRINLRKQFDRMMNDDSKDPQHEESLQYHIGYQPELKDGEVNWSSGHGQMKIVIGTMIEKNIEKAKGEAKANGPFWSKSLWHGKGAPNLMTVVKVAGTVAGGGPWFAFAMDALDTVANVAMGNMSLTDGAMGLAKGAVSGVASSAIAGLGDSLTAGMGSAGFGGVISTTVSRVATGYASTYATAAINAVEFDGGFTFNKSSFKKNTRNAHTSALRSGAIALSTSVANEALGGEFGERTYKDKSTGELKSAGYGYRFKDISAKGRDLQWSGGLHKVSGFAGGITGQALDVACGNGITLNLLNTRDLFGSSKDSSGPGYPEGNGIQHQGLFEMSIGGSKPHFTVLGSGGLDISGSSMSALAEGVAAADFQLENLSGADGLQRITHVNWLKSSVDRRMRRTGGEIFSGRKQLEYRDQGFERRYQGDNKYRNEALFGSSDSRSSTIYLDDSALKLDSKGRMGDESTGFFVAEAARRGLEIDHDTAFQYSRLTDRQKAIARHKSHFALNKVQAGFIDSINRQLDIEIGKKNRAFRDEYRYLKGFTGRWTKRVDPRTSFLNAAVSRDHDYKYRDGRLIGRKLDVPYGGYQYTNTIYPDSSCSPTTVSGMLKDTGINMSADQVATYSSNTIGVPAGYKFATMFNSLAAVTANRKFQQLGMDDRVRAIYGGFPMPHNNQSLWHKNFDKAYDYIQDSILEGSPVYMNTRLGTGHVIAAIGFDEKGLICHDSAGEHNQNNNGPSGYPNLYGQNVHYRKPFLKERRAGFGVMRFENR